MPTKNFCSIAIALLLAIVVTGCNKNASKPQQTVATTGDTTGGVNGSARAKWVSTLPIAQAVLNQLSSDTSGSVPATPGVLCAQITIPNSGEFQGSEVIELSMPTSETCPQTTLVDADPTTIIVTTFAYNSTGGGAGPTFDIILDGQTIGAASPLGGAGSAEPGDPNASPGSVLSLCDSDPNAYYGTPCSFVPQTYFISWN